MNRRKGYILTLDPESDRAIFSKNVLEKIGFEVIFMKVIPHENKVYSNKISMQNIYRVIIESQDDYAYVFEDDINVLDEISLDEIMEYEPISEYFFYLGLCLYEHLEFQNTGIQIRNHTVYSRSGGCRGLHAIGLSKKGAIELLNFSLERDEIYMDMILEKFSEIHPANICRIDLESYIPGHIGILYQDRSRFPSMI